MDTKFNVTKAVCRDVRAAVCAARKWPKSRTIYRLCRRRAFDPESFTANALFWSVDSFMGAPLERLLLGSESGLGAIVTAREWEGMCGFELECYSGRSPFLSTNTYQDTGFVLLSRDAEILESRIDNWGVLCNFARGHIDVQRHKRVTREKWTDAVTRWRKRAGMPKSKVPLGIVADYAQDADDGQEDAALIRAAIAANFKG